jgi:tetratricopeptide (TPR) repeat protein
VNKPTPDRSGSKGPRKPSGDRSNSGKPRTGGAGAGRGSTASGRGGNSSRPPASSSWSDRGDSTSGDRRSVRPAEGRPGKSAAGAGGDRRPPRGESPRSGDSRPRYDKPAGDSRPSRYSKPDGDSRPRYDKPAGDSRPSRYSKPDGDSRPRYDKPAGDDRRGPRSGDSRPSSGGYRPDRPAARAGGRPDSAGGPKRSSSAGYKGVNARPDSSSRRPSRYTEDRPREAPRPGLAAKVNEPATPKGLDLRQLPRGVRAELRGLTSEHAEVVGAHLLMAGQLIDTDPDLAYAHAEAARRRAARLPITREAAGETAYAAGNFGTALNEFRALRRMTGRDDYLAAMADCERALGRYQGALRLVKEGLAKNPEVVTRIELRLVEAGIRSQTGQVEEALRLLKNEIEELGTRGTKLARARLRYGYADLLERTGDGDQAERWFDAVVRLDPDDTTDAADRVAALRGIVIEYDDSDDEFVDEGEGDDEEDEAVEEKAVQPEEAVIEVEFIDLNDAVALDETDLSEAAETDEQ